MFGGLAFLINGNMAASASGQGGMLLRVEPTDTPTLVQRPEASRFQMRGREWMAGYASIRPAGYKTSAQVVDDPRRQLRPIWEAKWHITKSGEHEERAYAGTSYIDMLNELGSDGWELVAKSVLDTVIVTTQQGFQNVGTPIRMEWTFKRPAS